MDYLSHKKLITISIVLLFIQFWLGMSLNLFVDIPRDTFLNFFGYSGGIEVLAHIVNGFLILAVSLAILRQKVAMHVLPCHPVCGCSNCNRICF